MDSMGLLWEMFGDWKVLLMGGSLLLSVFYKILVFLYRALRVYGELFAMKRLKSLIFLRQDTRGGTAFLAFLDRNIELEMFRVASGMQVNFREMAAIIKIESLGLWSPEQIRALRKYLKCSPMSDGPKIIIGSMDRFEAYFGFSLSLILVAMAVLLWGLFVWKYSLYGALMGAFFFVLAIFVGGMLAWDFGKMKIAQDIKEYLNRNPGVLSGT
ncbi:hypothetical protein HNP46_001652 [Pseudomonas nitritireducens]|uniref:Uncharacterized protein n=1 Tax=Pseudomonas nitroreducens TaxID=46680 RepID=A0A7W7NZK1_PSENT|nr:hypothetical protein [Pseudomonas nitritireducens]MBB4862808.1 hypothetical protein [Pseudomonas nitritireducens]